MLHKYYQVLLVPYQVFHWYYFNCYTGIRCYKGSVDITQVRAVQRGRVGVSGGGDGDPDGVGLFPHLQELPLHSGLLSSLQENQEGVALS